MEEGPTLGLGLEVTLPLDWMDGCEGYGYGAERCVPVTEAGRMAKPKTVTLNHIKKLDHKHFDF